MLASLIDLVKLQIAHEELKGQEHTTWWKKKQQQVLDIRHEGLQCMQPALAKYVEAVMQ